MWWLRAGAIGRGANIQVNSSSRATAADARGAQFGVAPVRRALTEAHNHRANRARSGDQVEDSTSERRATMFSAMRYAAKSRCAAAARVVRGWRHWIFQVSWSQTMRGSSSAEIESAAASARMDS